LFLQCSLISSTNIYKVLLVPNIFLGSGERVLNIPALVQFLASQRKLVYPLEKCYLNVAELKLRNITSYCDYKERRKKLEKTRPASIGVTL
jgi:hypothetical protein